MFAVTYRKPYTQKPHAGSTSPQHRLQHQTLHARQSAGVRQILNSRQPQAKLKIGPANDRFEQEADRIAERVVSNGNKVGADAIGGHVDGKNDAQRMCKDCEEELQRKPGRNASANVTDGAVGIANPALRTGRKLTESQRGFFESRMGHGFADVRIHTDENAARSAEAMNARAYTLGKDIVFNKNQYRPGTREGDRLLAHELTHVVQQRSVRSTLFDDDTQAEPANMRSDPVSAGIAPEKLIQRSSSASDSSGSGENEEEGATPSPGTGSACKVDVRATHIGGILSGLPIWHLFIVYTDSTGTEFYYRGGPGGSCPGVSTGGYGTIMGTHGRYVAGTVDWDPSAPSVTVLSGAGACGKDSCFASELSRIDGTCTPYAPTGPNSNTVVSTLLSNCSMPRSKPVAIAPGWGDPNI